MMTINRKRWAFAPILLVIAVACAHSLLPHILHLAKNGDPSYFADSDDTELYLNYSSDLIHHGGWSLRDPITGRMGTFVPDAQLVPFVAIARMLNLEPVTLPILWRLWAGLSIAIAAYLLLNILIGSPWAAAITASILLTDAGLLSASPFLRQFQVGAALLFGEGENLLATFPQIHLQWRIITPGLSLVFLLLQTFFIVHARKTNDTKAKAAAIFFSASLMYLYFYFWTAAFLALALCFLFDRPARKLYFKVASAGFILGIPALIMGANLKKNSHVDALPRIDFFLPIDRFSQLLLPKTAILVIAIALASIPLGFQTRAIEATKTLESVNLKQAYIAARELISKAPFKPTKGIIAGNTYLASQISIQSGLRPFAGMMLSLSPSLSDVEWSSREALNSAVEGIGRETFSKRQARSVLNYTWGKWGRDSSLREKLYEERLAKFDLTSEALLENIDQNNIQFVVTNRSESAISSEFFDEKKFHVISEYQDWILLERVKQTNF